MQFGDWSSDVCSSIYINPSSSCSFSNYPRGGDRMIPRRRWVDVRPVHTVHRHLRLGPRMKERFESHGIDYKTSQMFLTMGLTPFCTGLRGSSWLDFGAIQASPLSLSSWCSWLSLTVSFDEDGLISSEGLPRSTRKGFIVNSIARGDISASMTSAARGRLCGRGGSKAAISVCSLWRRRCSCRFGEENLVRRVLCLGRVVR